MGRPHPSDPAERPPDDLPAEMSNASCPLYSGPGYDQKRHASRVVNLPRFSSPYEGTPQPPRFALEPLPASAVVLEAGSVFERAFATNARYLKLVDTESLLLSWRLTAPGGR